MFTDDKQKKLIGIIVTYLSCNRHVTFKTINKFEKFSTCHTDYSLEYNDLVIPNIIFNRSDVIKAPLYANVSG